MDANPREILKDKKAVIFDSDGVLVEEGLPLPGASELIDNLRDRGVKIVVLSNNSTKDPNSMRESYHMNELRVDNIVNSGMLAVKYCEDNQISSVFVVGEEGLEKLLGDAGIVVDGPDPDAVIVGMDRGLTYKKLAKATRLIRSGSRFIGTNPDKSFPTPRGLEPGAGSMIAALIASTDKEPEVILGKPESYGYELVLENYNLNVTECIMIGDRYETDILGAIKVGMPAIVVNTGVAALRATPGKYDNFPEVPVVNSLFDLIEPRV